MGWMQIALYVVLLVLLAKPLGEHMARVYAGERTFLTAGARRLERGSSCAARRPRRRRERLEDVRPRRPRVQTRSASSPCTRCNACSTACR
jgi:hypothetical protein